MPFIPSLNNNINKGSINMRNINMFDNSLNFAKNDKNNQISQNYEKSNVQISEKGVKNTIDLKAIQDEMLGKTKDKQLAISSSS